jgi:catechol 2,3-dioxygenase-like lactoylglutathione lyase family enzyme
MKKAFLEMSFFGMVGMLLGFAVVVAGGAAIKGAEGAGLEESKPLPNKKMVQVAVIVKDAEETAKKWADLLGVEVPKAVVSEPATTAKTMYRGKPTEARVKMVFFELDNLSLELLEPVGGPSVWREVLDEKGECVHHIAFKVEGMDEHIVNIEKKGMSLTQLGRWTEGSGGRYAYFDSEEELGVILELLESY